MKLRLLISTLFLAIGFAAFGQSIGLIGDATPGGWDADTNMIQHPDSAHLWSLDIQLIGGKKVKFRQDDAWTINWGSNDFPTGTGTQGGADIPIAGSGFFTVSFNSLTGAYHFALHSDIGILGDATPKGWDEDTNMYIDETDSSQYYLTLNLGLGKAKFRQDDAWTINWGSADFPAGIGTQGGTDIPVSPAGKYEVKFNKVTGAYSFTEKVDFLTIGLIGTATPSGSWDVDTNLVKDPTNPDVWKADMVLQAGEAKFRANDAWAVSWGDTLFPSGIATIGGPNIKVTAGEYRITFNTKTGAYDFKAIGNYASVGIIGTVLASGWGGDDANLDQDPTDKSLWSKRMVLLGGEAQFRANDAWDVSWGSGTFPTGTGEAGGANIPVPAGEYKISFNSTTGEYNFVEVIVFDSIGLIGNAIPGNNWDADVWMTKSSTNEYLFYITSIDLLDSPVDGGVKFRANAGWTTNWGAIDFPTGTGTQDGHNIEPVAGTYGITFITDTGEYAFGAPISDTKNLFTASAVALSPNPANDFVNIATEAKELTGDAHIIVFNNLGARVLEQDLTINGSANLNIATLKTGNYFVQISNGKYMVGKKLTVVR